MSGARESAERTTEADEMLAAIQHVVGEDAIDGEDGDLVEAIRRLVARAKNDADRLDWLDEDGLGTNYLRLRAGRNMIGIATGGWLLTHGRIGEGHETKHFDIRSAIDAGRGGR
jgi:hypothetical protein